ncbi:MAG: NAD-binding protein [Comamonadaceae bacterium]|nr:NAD-binding protein [Comamonadaceae bacterium]
MRRPRPSTTLPIRLPPDAALLRGHVIICGYGRIGQSVGHFLEEEKIPYVALDLDPARVQRGAPGGRTRLLRRQRPSGTCWRPSASATARLVVVSHDDVRRGAEGAAARARACGPNCR